MFILSREMLHSDQFISWYESLFGFYRFSQNKSSCYSKRGWK